MCDALLVCESTQLYKLCKACSSAQNCAALWKLCTSRYRRLQMLRGQAQVPLAMLPRSSSVNQHCLPRASPARREESLREGTSQGLLLCNTPKNRVAALLPRTVSRTTRVEAGPPPPPPAWPARNLLLETQRRRREKDTSLGRLVKRVSRSKPLCAGAAGRPKALFRDVSYALILFLSTHGRELLAQTAKTKVPSWNRQNYFIAPHSTRARLTRGGELGRNSVLKLHGGRPRQKKQP